MVSPPIVPLPSLLIVTLPIEAASLTVRSFVLIASEVTVCAVTVFDVIVFDVTLLTLRSLAISTVYVIGPFVSSFVVTLTLLEPASTLTASLAILLTTVLPALVRLDRSISAFVSCRMPIFLLFVSIRAESCSMA